MDDPIVVTNGRIIDGTGADPIDDGTVVIDGGEFRAVGKPEAVDPPEDAVEIDAEGKTVMPGLIEGHAHIGGSPSDQRRLRLSLQRGITTVCSVSSERGDASGIALRDGIENGDIRGCARLIAGCIVAPTFGHVENRTADGPWEVHKAVREMVELGADFIKTAASGGFWAEDEDCSVRNYTYEELAALADEAHAWDLPAVVHAHTQPGIDNAIEAGIDQIHHGAFIDEEGVRGILDNDLYYVPTLRVTADKNIDRWPDRPWMHEEMKEAQPIHREGARLAHEIGVAVCCGTDYPGSSLWEIGDATMWELRELVGIGMTPLEAIRASTQVTAEAYRIDDEIGTMEPGHRADLLVVDGNPAEDIEVLYDGDNVELVIKDGTVASASDAYDEFYTIREPQPPDRGN